MRRLMDLTRNLMPAFLILIVFSTVAISAEKVDAPKTDPLPNVEKLRDPFWPVGWWPPKVEVVTSENATQATTSVTVNWEKATKKMRIIGFGSSSKQGKFIATVSGTMGGIDVVGANDVLRVKLDSLIYRWKVTHVTSNSIKKTRLDVKPARKSSKFKSIK